MRRRDFASQSLMAITLLSAVPVKAGPLADTVARVKPSIVIVGTYRPPITRVFSYVAQVSSSAMDCRW